MYTRFWTTIAILTVLCYYVALIGSMIMNEKWFGITMCVFFIFAFGSLAYSEQAKYECRAAYAQTQWSAEDIIKVCK